MKAQLREMLATDWPEVARIYLQGIKSGYATFEQDVPAWESWSAAHLPKHRLLALDGENTIGWAALTPVSGRCVYAGVAEVSVYVDAAYHAMGIGKQLLSALIESSETDGIWTLQAGIFPENKASLQLHLSSGFRQVGHREKIGRMNGIWRDTVLLERRSKKL